MNYDTLTENKFLVWPKLEEAADCKLNTSRKGKFDYKENNL